MKDLARVLGAAVLVLAVILGLAALSQRLDDNRRKAERTERLLERQTSALERIAGAMERIERRRK